MSAYYYFAASLPMLSFDVRPSLTLKEFLQDCERLLYSSDFKDMLAAVYHHDEINAKNKVVRRWQEFMRNFRNEIAAFRANEFNKDPLFFIRGERVVEPVIVDALAEAGNTSNLLEADKVLGRAQWRQLEDIAHGHFFDFEYLVTYGLKLKMLERYQVIKTSRGREILMGYKEEALTVR